MMAFSISHHRLCHLLHHLIIIVGLLIFIDVASVAGFVHVKIPESSYRITALEAQSRKKKINKSGGGGKSKKKTGSISLGFGKAAGKWDGCKPLRNWMIERGADIEGVSVGIVNKETGLRGVTASKDFRSGDIVFSVPRSKCIIDESRVDSSPLSDALFPSKMDRDALPACARNALYLIWLERQGKANIVNADVKHQYDAWAPLLSALPVAKDFAADGGPMELWDTEEVSWVECAQLITEIRSRADDLRNQYENHVLPRWLHATSTDSNHIYLGEPPTLDEFRHAVCVVTSRNFGEGEANGGTSSMIVPGVDLCNHQDPPVHTIHGLSPEDDFIVYAKANIAAGEEIFLTYGPLPNRLLLAQFGFMLPGLPNEPLRSDNPLVRIDALFHPDDHDIVQPEEKGDDASRSIAELEIAADKRWETGPGPIALRGMRKEIIRNKTTKKVSRWQPAPLARMVVEYIADPAWEKNGVEVKKQYRALLQRELDAYSTNLADDEAELLTGPSSPRRNLALQFRIQSKRLLQKEIDDLILNEKV